MRVAVTILIFMLVLSSMGAAFQNEPDGDGEFKWGDPRPSNMEYVTTRGELKAYTRPGQELHFDEVGFEEALWLYYGSPERYAGLNLAFEGTENYRAIRRLTEGYFGRQTHGEEYVLTWQGQKTVIYLRYDPETDRGSFSYFSAKILDEISRQQEVVN